MHYGSHSKINEVINLSTNKQAKKIYNFEMPTELGHCCIFSFYDYIDFTQTFAKRRTVCIVLRKELETSIERLKMGLVRRIFPALLLLH